MRYFVEINLFFVLLMVLVSADFNTESLYYNGQQANEAEFPYQVGLLRSSPMKWCGGSLISQTFIITAAHCIDQVPAENITAYMGSIYFREGLQRVGHFKIVHPEYRAGPTINDIGLLQIDYVGYSSSIKNIALPDISDTYFNYEANVAIASGWGQYTDESGVSRVLQYAELLIISNAACSNSYEGVEIPNTVICAAAPNGAGLCHGDSGGPLVHKDTKILIGIASLMPQNVNCSAHFGSGFTRVTSYRQWIKDMTGI